MSRAFLGFSLLLAACGPRVPLQAHALLYATAWTQQSTEHAATTRQIYASAAAQLDAALADPTWTALPGQAPPLPPAVILDLDETVLDNTPWQVRAIRDRTSYPTGWEAWCLEGGAALVPGAEAFLRAAADRGVAVFYVSNRKAPVEAATRRNLEALGLPLDDTLDTVLLRGERPEWGSDKTPRREHVAATHRVVMLLGDNLGDFIDVPTTDSARQAALDDHASWWGTRWFMLPNPMYGSWVDAAMAEQDPNSGRDARVLRRLDDAR